jgi:hypothetical protein
MRTTMRGWRGPFALAVSVVVAGLGGCGSSKPSTPQCALNSDCVAPLVCALGYCVKQCNVSSDCPNNERCVNVGSNSASGDGGGGMSGAGGESSSVGGISGGGGESGAGGMSGSAGGDAGGMSGNAGGAGGGSGAGGGASGAHGGASGTGGLGGLIVGTACQAPETVKCQYNSQCKTPLVCGSDQQCRDMCEANVDCPMQQVCTSRTKLCADPSIDQDYDKATNDFVTSSGGSSGSSGAAGGRGGGGSGTGGTGGATAGGSGGVGGSTGGAGGGPHDAGSGGTTDGSVTPINGDPCVAGDGGFVAESTANDDPNHATPLTLGTPYQGCIETATDLDYFLLTVPSSSVQGGWVTVVVGNVAAQLYVENTVFSVADNGQINDVVSPNAGANASLYFAGKPGAQFLVRVLGYGQRTGAYTVNASFQDDPEPSEPNNTRAQATPLTIGTPFQGKFFAGYTTSMAPTNVDWTDWFSIPLTPGNFTVKLTNAPADITSRIFFYDTEGSQLSDTFSSSNTAGADLTATQTIATAGTYFVATVPFGIPNPVGTGTTLPMWATGTYTLTVAPAP